MLSSLVTLLPLLALVSATPIAKRDASRLIESGRNGGFCLSVEGGRAAVAAGKVTDGTPVVTLGCQAASFWDISRGSGSIVVSGTIYAFDIGLTPGNNGPVKVWTSYPTSTQQTWYLTDDNRIAQTGGFQCLDQGDNGPQTYECTTGNTNQVWNVRFNDPPPTPSASASSSASASASSTVPPVPLPTPTDILPTVPKNPSIVKDIAGLGQRLRPLGREDLCVTVAGGYAGIGARVGIAGCFGNGDTFTDLQLFDLPAEGTAGPVRLHSQPQLCLDAGDNPANGIGGKIWTCYEGLAQQQWLFSGSTLRTANNQCFDVVKESGPNNQKPYGTQADTQTWECSTNGDPYQSFHVLV
ncbi:uncharacterized protein MKK02DRAFT_39553 [Dioszegia hungarica]|uniref:Ricin B lectin domain-containing protein n=1 Tax=Dioszegia hungarica TaxID=4972 RepID=A0AA38HDP7_9TREE|nr:uncharacterized protein MKK02DRAFT_39553 [Dioszegia hungarica]KAI9639257.1 hypothetical protein MKK02DRAFT_39553 [Dioszegia hungarica]